MTLTPSNNKALILASSSPYRAELLSRLQVAFKQTSPDIDESAMSNETPNKLVTRLALKKAKALEKEYPHALIIASDQVAVLNGQVLGKPGDHLTATRQLQNAAGHNVTFLTSLCLYNSQTQRYQLDVVEYKVSFRDLSDDEIENYLRRETPYDCAGSFKSEGLGIALFSRQEGDDPTALIGLPLIRLISMLRNEDYHIL